MPKEENQTYLTSKVTTSELLFKKANLLFKAIHSTEQPDEKFIYDAFNYTIKAAKLGHKDANDFLNNIKNKIEKNYKQNERFKEHFNYIRLNSNNFFNISKEDFNKITKLKEKHISVEDLVKEIFKNNGDALFIFVQWALDEHKYMCPPGIGHRFIPYVDKKMGSKKAKDWIEIRNAAAERANKTEIFDLIGDEDAAPGRFENIFHKGKSCFFAAAPYVAGAIAVAAVVNHCRK